MLSLLRIRFKKFAWAIKHRQSRFALMRMGVLVSAEHFITLHKLEPSCIVDVGANKGQFTLLSRIAFPNIRVTAFEPNPNAYRIFQALHGNDPLVRLMPLALGSVSSEQSFNVTKAQDSSSLLRPTAAQQQLSKGSIVEGEIAVQVRRLDDFFDEIPEGGLLKIDIQGYELEMLKGAKNSLSKFSAVLVECSLIELYKQQALFGEIVDFLQTSGFTLKELSNPTVQHSQVIQCDALFTKSS